jgi:ABC-type phosphate/phosphonate transport system substrate-binding protein
VVRVCGLTIAAVLAVLSAAIGQNAQPVPPPNPPPNPKEVRIGFPDALFRDVPKTYINLAVIPFQDMIQKEIKMNGSMKICQDYADLADDLKNGKLDLAVFHGFEYAWVKSQPGIVPLVITNPSCGKVQACLVVHAGCKAKDPGQLKGACVAIPKGTKAHCMMFLKHLQDTTNIAPGDCCEMPPKAEALTPHETLNDIVSGKCEAALVDIGQLQSYQKQFLALGRQVKVLAQSEVLPPAVVVCRKGALTPDQVNKVRDGLLKCHTTRIGRTFTMFWQLDGFKDVTPEYQLLLEKTLKEYPPPVAIQGPLPMAPR